MLDHKRQPMAAPVQPLLPGLSDWGPAQVTVVEHAYRVDWGRGVHPRFHLVSKRKTCQCTLGPACPAVLRVREYLEAGGERAPDYPDDYWPAIPEACPICDSACDAYPPLSFTAHGLGWRCRAGGTLHYWGARLRPILRARQALNGQPRWVIPPAVSTNGELLYPGVTVDDVRLARERALETQRRWQAEGYTPWS
jgi:hypothetical protein